LRVSRGHSEARAVTNVADEGLSVRAEVAAIGHSREVGRRQHSTISADFRAVVVNRDGTSSTRSHTATQVVSHSASSAGLVHHTLASSIAHIATVAHAVSTHTVLEQQGQS
jgi:hypothetical protein